MTTDPVVATIFAVEASNFGHGVIYIARLADLAGVSIIPGNALAALEAEVGLAMVPLEFARRATRVVSTTDARMLLLALGITIRPSIRGPASVQIALEESPRLDPTRIQRFLQGVDRLESPI